MDLKLYGICFKLRGGPDLLDYVLTGDPVPMTIMEQVMTEMGSVTQHEMDFASKLDSNWKKALNERVPLLMGTRQDGGYNIDCEVPDELLNIVNMLYGLSNEKIVEEYTASYLKDVCGLDVEIKSVDVVEGSTIQVKEPEPVKVQQGFDLSDLEAVPDNPELEDVSELADLADKAPATYEEPAYEPDVDDEPEFVEEPEMGTEPEFVEEPVVEEEPEMGDEPDIEEVPDDYVPDEMSAYAGDEVPIEEGYPEPESFPEDEPDTAEEPEADVVPEEESNNYGNALKGIYTELVGNIKEKKLDARLGLKIGQ